MRLAVLAASLLVAGITQASAVSQTPAVTQTYLAQVHETSVPEPGTGAVGDRELFNDMLTLDGRTVGEDSGVCTATGASPQVILCSYAFVLIDGTISTVFAIDGLTQNKAGVVSFPLLGGTGAYAGRTGVGSIAQQPGGSTEKLTFAFADPSVPPPAGPHAVNPQ